MLFSCKSLFVRRRDRGILDEYAERLHGPRLLVQVKKLERHCFAAQRELLSESKLRWQYIGGSVDHCPRKADLASLNFALSRCARDVLSLFWQYFAAHKDAILHGDGKTPERVLGVSVDNI